MQFVVFDSRKKFMLSIILKFVQVLSNYIVFNVMLLGQICIFFLYYQVIWPIGIIEFYSISYSILRFYQPPGPTHQSLSLSPFLMMLMVVWLTDCLRFCQKLKCKDSSVSKCYVPQERSGDYGDYKLLRGQHCSVAQGQLISKIY